MRLPSLCQLKPVNNYSGCKSLVSLKETDLIIMLKFTWLSDCNGTNYHEKLFNLILSFYFLETLIPIQIINGSSANDEFPPLERKT